MGAATLLAAALTLRAGDPTWNYAVQASAVVSASPARITLSWVEDTTQGRNGYVPSYTVARKLPWETGWGLEQAVPRGESTWTDPDVQPGMSYEYQVIRTFSDPAAPEADHVAYGYLLSGINVPFPEHRGRVILVVEDAVALKVADRIRRLRNDLVGDGWLTTQINVSADSTPAQVRERIRAAYFADGTRASTVFLLGRIPVAKSGNYAPDLHEKRAMPCDAYYGDVDGGWDDANGDGVFDDDVLTSDIEMAVGRVDFSNLEGAGTGLDEYGLMARYLDKDHAYRHGTFRFDRRALVADRIGIDRGRAPAGAAFRMFSAFFGAEHVLYVSTEDNTPDDERWLAKLRASSPLWAFGSGGGGPDMIGSLGFQGEYKYATSADLAEARAGFYLLFGSYFVEWQLPNNLLRSALAAPSGGLGAAWSGRPSFVLHPMALGETVGEGVRLAQNNVTTYYSPRNAYARAVHVAWLGDPTLRLDVLMPPQALTGAGQGGATVKLAWRAPADTSGRPVSYHVFRATSMDSPFARLTSSAIDETTWSDAASFAGAVYMVRAVVLEEGTSGSYFNPSQGVFWTYGGEQPDTLPSTDPNQVRIALPLLFTPRNGQRVGPRVDP